MKQIVFGVSLFLILCFLHFRVPSVSAVAKPGKDKLGKLGGKGKLVGGKGRTLGILGDQGTFPEVRWEPMPCITHENYTCPKDYDGTVGHCDNCEEFTRCRCANGTKWHMLCPPMTYFDMSVGICVMHPRETCGGQGKNGTCICPYYDDEPVCMNAGDICTSLSMIQQVAYPSCTNCAKYFVCPYGSKYRLAERADCPNFQFFDMTIGNCTDVPSQTCQNLEGYENCTCHNRPYGPCMEDGGDSQCDPQLNMTLPHCDSCLKYFQCTDGVKYAIKCPKDTFYDLLRKRCVIHPIQTCKDYETPEPCDCPYDLDDDPACLEEGDICGNRTSYPSCTSCTERLVCDEPKTPARLEDCPENQYVDFLNGTCQEQPNSTCAVVMGCNCSYVPPAPPIEPICLNGSETCTGASPRYADCNDCQTYHLCSGEGATAIRQNCPEHEYYDWESHICHQLPNSTCKEKTKCNCTYDPKADHKCMREKDLCTGIGKMYPDCDDCQIYRSCGKKGENSTKQFCPPYMYYDSKEKKCDMKPKETCLNVSETCTCDYDPNYTDPLCLKGGERCYGPTTIFPACDTCHAYYTCNGTNNSTAKINYCAPGTYYDWTKKVCMALPISTCEDHREEGCECNRYQNDTFCLTLMERTCPRHGNFSDCEHCGYHHVCNNTHEISHRVECPENQYFDWAGRRCKKDPDMTCKNITSCYCPYPPPPTECMRRHDLCTEEGMFPDCGYCRIFYLCTEIGKKSERFQCPNGEYFDWTNHHCTADPVSTCKDHRRCKCDPPEDPGCLFLGDQCPAIPGLFPDCTDCHSYFKCSFEGDKAQLKHCLGAGGAFFDWTIRLCVADPLNTCNNFTNCTCDAEPNPPDRNETDCDCVLQQIAHRQKILMDKEINVVERIPYTNLFTGIDYHIFPAEYPDYRWKRAEEKYPDGTYSAFVYTEQPQDQELCDPCAMFRFFSTLNGTRLHLLNRCGDVGDYKSLVMPYNSGCLPGMEGWIETQSVSISKKQNFGCYETSENVYCQQPNLLDICIKEVNTTDYYLGYASFKSVTEEMRKYLYTPGIDSISGLTKIKYYETQEYNTTAEFNFKHYVKPVCECFLTTKV